MNKQKYAATEKEIDQNSIGTVWKLNPNLWDKNVQRLDLKEK